MSNENQYAADNSMASYGDQYNYQTQNMMSGHEQIYMKNPLALTPFKGKRTKTRDGSTKPGKKSNMRGKRGGGLTDDMLLMNLRMQMQT